MYHIAICDDEKKFLNEIVKKVKKDFEEKGIPAEYFSMDDAREFMDFLQRETVNVLFLDIDMPYFTGMDIAGFIREKGLNTILVFVTSQDALVYQTFAYRPFAFIRKTHMDEELGEVTERIKKELMDRKQELLLTKGQELIRVRMKDIFYIEAEGNYLNIFGKNGVIKHRETMTNMETELSGKGFLRCHKGYLVNSEYIEKVRSTELEVGGGEENTLIPIGRSYEKEVKKKIMELLRD